MCFEIIFRESGKKVTGLLPRISALLNERLKHASPRHVTALHVEVSKTKTALVIVYTLLIIRGAILNF